MCSNSGKPGPGFCPWGKPWWVCSLGNPAQELTRSVNCSSFLSKLFPELTTLSCGLFIRVSTEQCYNNQSTFSWDKTRSVCLQLGACISQWRAVIVVLLFSKSSLLFHFFSTNLGDYWRHLAFSGLEQYSYRPFHSNMWKTCCSKVKEKAFPWETLWFTEQSSSANS